MDKSTNFCTGIHFNFIINISWGALWKFVCKWLPLLEWIRFLMMIVVYSFWYSHANNLWVCVSITGMFNELTACFWNLWKCNPHWHPMAWLHSPTKLFWGRYCWLCLCARLFRFQLDTVPVECVESSASCVVGILSIEWLFWQKISSLASLIQLRWLVLSCMMTVNLSIVLKWSLSICRCLKGSLARYTQMCQ